METLVDLLFLVNLSFLMIGHELDAIKNREWCFFFASTPLSDQAAYRLFTALHIPFFIFAIWNLQSRQFQVGFDLFMVIHAGLHWFLRKHPQNSFDNWFSHLWIFGSAILGIIHLILLA